MSWAENTSSSSPMRSYFDHVIRGSTRGGLLGNEIGDGGQVRQPLSKDSRSKTEALLDILPVPSQYALDRSAGMGPSNHPNRPEEPHKRSGRCRTATCTSRQPALTFQSQCIPAPARPGRAEKRARGSRTRRDQSQLPRLKPACLHDNWHAVPIRVSPGICLSGPR